MRTPVLALAATLACAAGCGPGADAGAPGPTVAAAASLRELLEGTAARFVAERGGAPPSFSFSASSTLARQIAAGAGFDVFVSADPDVLPRAGERLGPPRAILGNRLALVGRPGAPELASPRGLLGTRGPIAVAAPAVPAGRYAREWLAAQGLLEALEPRFVLADHVRAALALVESGAAEHGFCYATDARVARAARTLWTQPPDTAPRIVYVVAAVRPPGAPAGERLPEPVEGYLDFLAGPAFAEAARALGFGPAPR